MATNGNGNGNGNGERMTGLQLAFVDAWFATRFNGTQAARIAGYRGDDNTLASQASVNLRKPKVQAEIERRWEAHGGSASEVIGHLWEIARHSDAARFVMPGGSLDYPEMAKHPELIQAVSTTKDGWRIQCYSRLDALKELARLLVVSGMLGDGEWEGEVHVVFKGQAGQE